MIAAFKGHEGFSPNMFVCLRLYQSISSITVIAAIDFLGRRHVPLAFLYPSADADDPKSLKADLDPESLDDVGDRIIPAGWFDQWARATLAEDPWSNKAGQTFERLRATSGPILDIRHYWRAGKPYYNPCEITVPVLLLHGEWDVDVPIDLALQYFRELRSARYRRWVEIGETTHMAVLEKNRLQAFQAISTFFEEDYAPE